MSIFVKASGLYTTLGDLNRTWDGFLSHKVVQKNSRSSSPLAEITELQGKYGSKSRYDQLLDILLQDVPALDSNTPLICSTTKAAVDELFHSSPPDSSQPWTMADDIARKLGLLGSRSCVSAACASGTIAIIQGAQRIISGECSHALIVGCDILSNFVINGFTSLRALSRDGCRPYDVNRDGLTLGEGGGWVLLSNQRCRYGKTKEIIVLNGWATSCDASHITAPCRNGSGLIRVLQRLTENNTHMVGAINGHGTGTSYNDAMELLAFDTVFKEIPPLCSNKGAIGHCLGAAGIIEAILSIESLLQGMIPPTIGLLTPEKKCSHAVSGTTCLDLVSPTILSCNSGFGGINSGILLKKIS